MAPVAFTVILPLMMVLPPLEPPAGPFGWSHTIGVRPVQVGHVASVAIDYLARELKLDGHGAPTVLLVEVTQLSETTETGS
jgi:hypothetical protein